MVNYTIPDFLLTKQYIAENISPNNDLFTQNNQTIDRIPPLGLDNVVTWNSDVFQDIDTRINNVNLEKIGVEGETGQLLGFSDDNVLAPFDLQELITSQGPLVIDGSEVVENTLYGNALRTNSVPAGKLGSQSVSFANMHADTVTQIENSTIAALTGATIISKIPDNGIPSAKLGPLSVTSDKVAAGAITLSKLSVEVLRFLIPVGTIHEYGGGVAPEGFLLCDGSAVSRVDYAALFAVLGTAFGAGDGATTFNVPDKRGRVAAGSVGGTAGRITAATSTTTNIGGTGGFEQITLDITQIPPHSHAYSIPTYRDFYQGGGGGVITTVLINDGQTESVGGGQSHNNMPPFVLVNYIIKY